jgi:competence ComEA-like helix-hairpin-helix protein
MKKPGFVWAIIIAFTFFPHIAIVLTDSARGENRNKLPELKLASVDINQASEKDFTKLPGVGPELAKRIVAYRTKHGRFRRVEDLLVIRGIGRKKWKTLKPYVRVETTGSGVERRLWGFGRNMQKPPLRYCAKALPWFRRKIHGRGAGQSIKVQPQKNEGGELVPALLFLLITDN